MNLEKLKQHECRFCAKLIGNKCKLQKNECRYQSMRGRMQKILPDRWELHPDIVEAMPETTELKTIKPDYEAIMDKYLDTLPSDTAKKWAAIGFKAGLAVKKSEEL